MEHLNFELTGKIQGKEEVKLLEMIMHDGQRFPDDSYPGIYTCRMIDTYEIGLFFKLPLRGNILLRQGDSITINIK